MQSNHVVHEARLESVLIRAGATHGCHDLFHFEWSNLRVEIMHAE